MPRDEVTATEGFVPGVRSLSVFSGDPASARAKGTWEIASLRERPSPQRANGTRHGRGGWALLATLALAMAAAAMPASSQAADALEYYASVDRDSIGVDETVHLSVTMSGGKEPDTLQLPRHPDFELLSQSRSEQMSFGFGGGGSGFKKTRTYTLVLRPSRQGVLEILPGYAVVDGKRFETGKLTVKVGPPGSGAPPPGQGQRRGWPSPLTGFPNLPNFDDDFDPFGALRQDQAPPSGSDVALRASVDKSEVYVGEQVTLTLYLMARVDVSGIESLQMPKLDGFWSEDIESPTQISGETRTIDGVAWRFYLLRKRALFPLRDGELTVDPAQVDILAGGGPFSRRVKIRRQSAETAITVKALPAGAPPAFHPASVGAWSLEAEVDPTTAPPGAPITVRVRATGVGNLGSLELPAIPAIEGMKSFTPSLTDEIDVARGRYGGRRTQEYVLVPSRSGSFTIPALELPYFNPGTGRYEVARSRPVSLRVLPGGATESKGTPVSANPGGDDGGLAPLRIATTIAPASTPLFSRPWFPFAVALPPLSLFAALLVPRLSSLRVRSGGRSKRGGASEAHRRLAAARVLAEREDPRLFDDLDLALHAAVEEILGRRAGGFSRDQLTEALAEAGVAADVVSDLCGALDTCDAGRFAPGSLGRGAATAAIDRAATIVDALQAAGRGAREAGGRKGGRS